MPDHLQRKQSCSLTQIHHQLNLSQSSLASSLDHLPNMLNFTGIVTDYRELQLVQWQKEVLITISEGDIETLQVSMWLNHENPVGLRIRNKYDLIGQLVHLRNVHVTSFDYTNPANLQFYGEMRPEKPEHHTILVLVTSGASLVRFRTHSTPFRVNNIISLVPKVIADKRSCKFYPLLPEDHHLMKQISGIIYTFQHCISLSIKFTPPRNPFQAFINEMLALETSILQSKIYYSHRWIRSYLQQAEWENKQDNLNAMTRRLSII